MAPEKLPPELEEEILIRTQPISLSRFRTVCKRWKSLFNDKRFVLNNFHLARPRPEFIIQSESKTYSLRVSLKDDPQVMERELTHSPASKHSAWYGECNGFLLRRDPIGKALVWNPLLKQTRWIEPTETELFSFQGLGYDNRQPEKSYKILGFSYHNRNTQWRVFEFLTNAWKSIDAYSYQEICAYLQVRWSNVSLNGNLYWTAYNRNANECCIICFDFSLEIFKHFCVVPCAGNSCNVTPSLGVYKGGRLSLLQECYGSKIIKVWVTKNKIDDSVEGKGVVWMIFMTVSIPNNMDRQYWPAYFIEEIHDKSLVMYCYSDESRKAYIYVLKGDVYKKIGLGYKVKQHHHCITYIPSLVPIPM